MDTAHWPQEFGVVKPMQELKPPTTASNNCTNTAIPTTRPQVQVVERKERPQKEQAINCPRCNSTNTKFCYYNNYSLTQPRYFCKACRRYWTEGGSLRNVPVGGGSRKNKRTSSTTTTTASTTVMTSSVGIDKKLPSHELIAPKQVYEGHDLNLSFPYNGNSNNNSSNLAFPFPRASGIGGFMQMGTPGISEYSATFGMQMQEFRPGGGLNFTLDGIGGDLGGGHNGRMLLPFDDLKPVVPASSAGFDQFEQNRGQTSDVPGYWNGMIRGGGSWVG